MTVLTETPYHEPSDEEIANLYPKFMSTLDPTEYKFAIKHVGSWELWQTMLKIPRIKIQVDKWRRELDVKIRSEALARILEASQGETRDALGANRYLLEANFLGKEKVGRPSKEAIATEAKKIVARNEQVEEDYKRLFNDAKRT